MKSPDNLQPLAVSSETFRSAAQRVMDLAAQFLDELPVKPSFPPVSGERTTERFAQPLGEIGLGEKALDALIRMAALIHGS
jgi:hypothetical protein